MAGAVRIETCPSLTVAQHRLAVLTAAGWKPCIAQGAVDIGTFTVDANNAPTNTGNTGVNGQFIVLAIRCDA